MVAFTESAHRDPIVLPHFPRDEDPDDDVPLVRQTAAEIEPLFVLALMCDSRRVANVDLALKNPADATFTGAITPTGGPHAMNLFDPSTNDGYDTESRQRRNVATTKLTVGWQRLEVDGRRDARPAARDGRRAPARAAASLLFRPHASPACGARALFSRVR